ncbi:MAG: ABC transporter permease [Ottowia sp.]|uniref:ABC transporter permease n=1 Tax=unclassified Ottowia TaxID=2645081 RepID=UPI003C2F83E8
MSATAEAMPPAASQWALLGRDIRQSLRLWRLWTHLGWGDILKQYRRSFLGPVWLTLNSMIFIVVFSFIGAQLFNQTLGTYLSYFCLGHVYFGFLAATINDGCQTYIASEAFLKQTPYPKMVFVFRVVWRNLLMLAHSVPIVLGVLWWTGLLWKIQLGWWVLGFVLTVAAAILAVALLGALAARFRDVSMIVLSFMQIALFVTPVMWQADQLTGRARLIVHWNPLAAFLELLRAPLLGRPPSSEALTMAVSIILLLAVLYAVAYVRVRRRIVYWL